MRWGDTILKETEAGRNPDEGVKSSRRKVCPDRSVTIQILLQI
jgi:hypothetical protein